MPFNYKVEIMPSSSVSDTVWLNAQGSGSSRWQLVQVIPLAPIVPLVTGSVTSATQLQGKVLCYFVSGTGAV